jgi:DNA-binding CsgD family transcriptional regulator
LPLRANGPARDEGHRLATSLFAAIDATTDRFSRSMPIALEAMDASAAATRRRQRDELVRHVGRAGSAAQIFTEASRRLRRLVPFDAAAWAATDPATGLPTAPTIADGLSITSAECSEYWRREFIVDDVNRFRDLARARRPAATMRATVGDRGLGSRYRNTVGRLGFEDELRAVFRAGDAPWGTLTLWRHDGRAAFTPAETDLVASLSAPIGEALRLGARPPDDVARLVRHDAPGLMTFDLAANLVSADAQARRWLAELPPEPARPTEVGIRIPIWMRVLVIRAGAVVHGAGDGTARARVRLDRGRWLICHASCLRDDVGDVASTVVAVEPATPAEIAPLIVAAYDLSPREEEITRLVARGLGTADIAASLFLSAHTVRDHLKTIFQKIEVSSRGELVAKLFADHYEPVHLAHGHAVSEIPLT